MDPIRVEEIPVIMKNIDAGETVEMSDKNSFRTHALVKYEGTDFYVAYTNAKPESTDEMTLIDTNYKLDYFEGTLCPKSKIFYHNGTGSAANFKLRTA